MLETYDRVSFNMIMWEPCVIVFDLRIMLEQVVIYECYSIMLLYYVIGVCYMCVCLEYDVQIGMLRLLCSTCMLDYCMVY